MTYNYPTVIVEALSKGMKYSVAVEKCETRIYVIMNPAQQSMKIIALQ